MDRTHSPDASATLPAYSSSGTPGYFAVSGTTIGAQWLNQVGEEIRNAIILGGGTPDPLRDDQLAEALSGTLCVTASATDTGVVTQPLDRVVVGCASSQATGATSHLDSSDHSQATGARSSVSSSTYGYATGAGSHALGGQGYEVHSSNTWGMGWSGDPASVVPAGADQNLTIMAEAETGYLRASVLQLGGPYPGGSVGVMADRYGIDVGGDAGYVHCTGAVTAGTTITAGTGLTVTSGDVTVTDGVTIGGDLSLNGGYTRHATGTTMTTGVATINDYMGSAVEVMTTSWNANAVRTVQIICDKIPSFGMVIPSVLSSDGTAQIAAGVMSATSGVITIWAKNVGGALTNPTIWWRFMIVEGIL